MSDPGLLPPVFYIVRESWDTGYEDFDFMTLEGAESARNDTVDIIVRKSKMPRDEALKFVKIYKAVEV